MQVASLPPNFTLALFFESEDRGDMFLRNVRCISMDCTVYVPEDRTLHNHGCQEAYTA
jgi:hypothetical protein